MSDTGSAIESASAPAVTGPRPCRRPRTISTSASSHDHDCAANSLGAAIGGERCACGNTEANCGRRSAATHNARFGGGRFRRSGRREQSLVTRFASVSVARNARHGSQRATSASVTKASPSKRVMQLVRRFPRWATLPHGRARSRRDRGDPNPPPILRRASVGPSRRACGALRAARRRGTRTAAHPGSRARAARARSARGIRFAISPDSSARSRFSRPSMSIASCRQSWTV